MATKRTTKKTENAEFFIKVNDLVLPLQSNISTIQLVRRQVDNVITFYGMDKQKTKITLPNGTVIEYKDLNNFKNFARILFPAQFLDATVSAENKLFMDSLLEIQKIGFTLPIDWALIGTKDFELLKGMYAVSNQKAIESEKVAKEVKLIG